MSRCVILCRFFRRLKFFSACKYFFTFIFLLCILSYTSLKVKLSIDYHYAQIFYQTQQIHPCSKSINSNKDKQKLILFWTKIFSDPIDAHYLNNYLFTTHGHCRTDQCKVTTDRERLCESDAVIFHARGGIKMNDMPTKRSPHQRYVLLTKEPPYKTTAIVGYLKNFFNWTATVSIS